MAEIDFDHTSTEVEWSIQPAYTGQDQGFVCSMTGFAQRKGEVVYRGSFIDEFVGFFTIGQDSAEQLARLIGWVDPDTIDSTVQQAIVAQERIEALELQVASQELVIEAYQVIEEFETAQDEEG